MKNFILLVALAACLLTLFMGAGLIIVGAFLVIRQGDAKPETIGPQTQLAKQDPKPSIRKETPTMTRTDLRKKLIGLTVDELRNELGNPDNTHDAGKEWSIWNYKGMTIDEANGKQDRYLQIRIDKGKVKSVTCY